mgnify:CR=1 FL=1
MLSQSGIHIWGSPHHALQPFEFEGTDGKVAICPMPFSEPRRIGDALGLSSATSSLEMAQYIENVGAVEAKLKRNLRGLNLKKHLTNKINEHIFAPVVLNPFLHQHFLQHQSCYFPVFFLHPSTYDMLLPFRLEEFHLCHRCLCES